MSRLYDLLAEAFVGSVWALDALRVWALESADRVVCRFANVTADEEEL